MAKYEVVAINRRTQKELRWTWPHAPTEQQIANFLERKHSPDGSLVNTWAVPEWIVTRYYPSKKGWAIVDYEYARPRPLHSRPHIVLWQGIKRGTRVYPSQAAALMKISYLIAMPEQMRLIL